jgi:predicted negative regulator of RcsB-dependent stress response
MSKEQSPFTKKHEEAVAQDERAILEEMNLPPFVIDFLRKNSKNIKIFIALLVVGIIAWEGFGEYSKKQREKASSLLYSAVKTEDSLEKSDLLVKLEDDFSGSKSALWAKLELGHLAFKNDNFQDAIVKYNEVLSKLSSSDSLYPLVQFSIAQAYDSMNDNDQADSAYRTLLDYTGFAAEGYLGLGRLNEKKGDNSKALEMYKSYISLPDIESGPTYELVQYKIANLK